MANSGYGDACPNCGCTFWGDDYNGSDRSEFTCPCGDLTCCQSCSDDAEQCAQCNQVLCECDGGHDLAGERYCSQHLQPSTTFQQVAGRRHQYREDDEMRVQELRTIRGQQNSTAILAGMLDLAVSAQHERSFLTICQTLFREDGGDSTPFENFIVGLINAYSIAAYKPDQIECDLEQFRANYQCAIRDARKIVDEYMDEFLPVTGSEQFKQVAERHA